MKKAVLRKLRHLDSFCSVSCSCLLCHGVGERFPTLPQPMRGICFLAFHGKQTVSDPTALMKSSSSEERPFAITKCSILKGYGWVNTQKGEFNIYIFALERPEDTGPPVFGRMSYSLS